jgi:hypothetical protein
VAQPEPVALPNRWPAVLRIFGPLSPMVSGTRSVIRARPREPWALVSSVEAAGSAALVSEAATGVAVSDVADGAGVDGAYRPDSYHSQDDPDAKLSPNYHLSSGLNNGLDRGPDKGSNKDSDSNLDRNYDSDYDASLSYSNGGMPQSAAGPVATAEP